MKHSQDVFYRSSCQDIEFDEYLLLGGGTDINPAIYNEVDHGFCQSPNNRRDAANIAAIDLAVKEGKPIFGICRGLQLLDAYFGGKLVQHTKGQRSNVEVLVDVKGSVKAIDDCSSCHHQMVDDTFTKGEILGYSENRLQAFFADGVTEYRLTTPEIIYWPKYKALAVQFHPEWHGPRHEMNAHLRGLVKELLGLENVL